MVYQNERATGKKRTNKREIPNLGLKNRTNNQPLNSSPKGIGFHEFSKIHRVYCMRAI